MSRTWAELFGDEPTAEDEPERTGFFGRLRDSLAKSRRALTAEIAAGTFDAGDEEAWERLEEALIHGDVGVRATAEIVRRLEARGELDDLGEALAEEIELLFGDATHVRARREADRDPRRRRQRHRQDDDRRQARPEAPRARPHRARRRRGHVPGGGRGAARDLGRAGGADFVGAPAGGDPAAVAFDAVEAGKARGRDVVIIDTAGRLHTQANLMGELAKVRRVIEGRIEGAPHETLLVVDATTGQNGLQQARLFGESAASRASP